jgi:hypothetical protein
MKPPSTGEWWAMKTALAVVMDDRFYRGKRPKYVVAPRSFKIRNQILPALLTAPFFAAAIVWLNGWFLVPVLLIGTGALLLKKLRRF